MGFKESRNLKENRQPTGARATASAFSAISDDLTTINSTLGTINTNLTAQAEPAGARDAFARLRTSAPVTLFDSKQLFDNAPFFWDDAAVSGAGTSSTHSTARASTIIGVSATTAGKRVRQTFQRFNYQPGKSHLVMMTGIIAATGGGTGIKQRIGAFDDDNGIFWSYDAGTLKVVIRSKVSGAAVDTAVSQASFNGDTLDGTGASGITIDVTKVQIWWFDYEWLGVGRVRFGIIVNGEFIVAHTVTHANSNTSVYMSTPNLPLRYAIENDGTGAASTLETICATVISEGGHNPRGTLLSKSTEGTTLTASTSGTIYAVLGLRLKTTHLGAAVAIDSVDVIAKNAVDFIWTLRLNPTVAGTFTYSDVSTNSALQSATGATANTVTGGTVIKSGFVKSSASSGSVVSAIENAVRLGASIAGTRDTLVLCVRPLANNLNAEGAINWRELT